MGLNLSLNIGQNIEQRQAQRLSHDQKQSLALLLKVELRDPYVSSVRGIEGMRVADRMLKEQDATGILIGGLAQSVWNKNRRLEDLEKHKDVDVLVIDDHFDIDRFEGGIDWWLPQEGFVEYVDEYNNASSLNAKWWQNGNGIILSYAVNFWNEPRQKGLYIPSIDTVINMRMSDALSGIPIARLMKMDDDVTEKFEKNLRVYMSNVLMSPVRREFKNILSSENCVYSIQEISPRELLSTIRSRYG